MSAARVLLASFDLNAGPIGYRVFEDRLELTVGEDDSEMIMTLNLSVDSVTTLASLFGQVLPMLLENVVRLAEGRMDELISPDERVAVIGSAGHCGSFG